jgi:DNA-binding FrmR family transcriptional regulator
MWNNLELLTILLIVRKSTSKFLLMEAESANHKHPTTDHTPHHHSHHLSAIPHVHNEASLRKIINRLSRIEGHIRGIKTMVTESRPCPEVLVQIAAVRGAIDRVARLILDEHLSDCIARAAEQGNIEAEIEELKAALDRFLP